LPDADEVIKQFGRHVPITRAASAIARWRGITTMDITAVLINAQESDRHYVLPCTLRELGIRAWELGHDISGEWPDVMRRGWVWAYRMAAYADGAEYMVGQGQEVSI
jgi:hypothetical protein